MHRIKKVAYSGFNNQTGEVLYVIIDGNCTFTAVRQDTTSSINAAERIMRAICEVETCNEWQLDFFDLQTHRGYRSKAPGEYEYDRIRLNLPGASPQWHPAPLPSAVRRIFAKQIG